MRRAWIISIGTELTLGQSVDTNSAWLAQRLAERGVRSERHVTVPDDLAPIVAALADASNQCDVVVVTGGLGPTDDDLTRQAIARVAGVPLELHEESLERIRAFFASRGRAMRESNRVQAMLPRGGRAIPNPGGTAPGVEIRIGKATIFALPGVPFEMKAMFDAGVAPALEGGGGEVLLCRRIRTCGLPESEVGERLRDLMVRGRNPEVGTTADLGEIGVRINATAQTTDAARDILDRVEADVRQRLGVAVVGADGESLAAAVGAALVRRNETVCTAESCTGGMIGAALTDVPGSSRYYLGGVIAYSNRAKRELIGVDAALLEEHGAVSEPVALAMAHGGRERFHAAWAVSVTGIAGPGGGTSEKPVGLVYIGLAGPNGASVRELRLGTDWPREAIRVYTTRMALNLLRLALVRSDG